MNTRIRDLAHQFGFQYSNDEWVFGSDESLEKFAEGLIKECANYVERLDNSVMMPQTKCAVAIRKHFGVE